MEMWKNLLLIIVSICCLIILITVATRYFKADYKIEELHGSKQLAIGSILDLVYKCYEKNTGKEGSVICYSFEINLDETIISSDIVEKIDSNKISKYQVQADDLGYSGEIVIIYENEIIYVSKVENERISS